MRLFLWFSNTVEMDKIGPKKANRQIRLQINWGHYYSNNYLATKIQFKYLNKNQVLPQCAISWCVDVKIVRKRVIKTVHFDNGRKRAKNRKLVTSVRDLLLWKKREKAALWVWSEKLCGNSGGNYCSLEDMNLTNIKTMFPETCKKLLQVEFYYFYYYTVMQN